MLIKYKYFLENPSKQISVADPRTFFVDAMHFIIQSNSPRRITIDCNVLFDRKSEITDKYIMDFWLTGKVPPNLSVKPVSCFRNLMQY